MEGHSGGLSNRDASVFQHFHSQEFHRKQCLLVSPSARNNSETSSYHTGNRSSRYTTQCVDILEQSKDVGAALLKLSNKISLLPRHIFQLLLNFPSKLENCVCFKWSFYSKNRPYSSQFIWSMWDTEV